MARCPRLRPAGIAAVVACVVVALAWSACTRAKPAAAIPVSKPKLTIAAAASVRFALPEIIAAYSKETGETNVEAVYASSGSIVSQIASKAPFDVFLSADEKYPVELIKNQHGVGGSLVRYATGRIAIWVPADSPLDPTKGISILGDERIQKIAIANPAVAPYGVAAEEAMKGAGVVEPVLDRLVLGENIAQAAQFVESGAAQVGILALSVVMSPSMKDKGRWWIIPETAHTPIVQSGCISAYAKDRAAAERFMTFLQTEPAREILRRNGFGIPGE